MLIETRLLDAVSEQELYAKTFVVRWKMKIENAVLPPADPKSPFKSLNNLMANMPLAVAGLVRGCDIVAQQIGDGFKSL